MVEGEEDGEYELNQEQIIQTILVLGNEIWKNFGQTQPLEDVRIFFQHTFYINCFQLAYPDIDFSNLLDEEDEEVEPEKMAEAIQALIDLLGTEILMYDMSHIRGDEIVNGNPEHIINLLQILQQISQASLLADDEDEADGSGVNEQGSPPGGATDKKQSSAKQSRDKARSNRSQEKRGDHRIIGLDGAEDDDGDNDSPNKQQFLDDLQDEEDLEHHEQRRVGDEIGNISQELDIEFDNDIQDNLQNMERESGESGDGYSGAKGERDDYGDRHGNMVDHNDVNIIDDGADFDDQDEDEDDDDNARPLLRHNENIGDQQHLEAGDSQEGDDQHQDEDQYEDQGEDQDDMYGEEGSPGDGMNQFHDQLKNLEDDEEDERQIIDDQNLEMDLNHQHDDEDEGQHYPDEEEGDEDIMQLEEMEAQMQQQQHMMHMPNQDFDEIDPEILEAAEKLGLDDEGIRALQQQMYEQQELENQEEDDGEQDEDSEGQELAEMLNGQAHRGGRDEQQIVRGGQNISDDDQEEVDDQMARQLQQIDGEDGNEEYGGEEDEDQLIDIDNLNDNEKVILIQYLQDEYAKDPDNLPMPREVIEQFLEDNKELVEMINNQQNQDDGDEAPDGQGEEEEEDDEDQMQDEQDINDGAMMIQGEDGEGDGEDDEQNEPEFGDELEDGEHQEHGDEEYEGEEQQESEQIINPQYQLEDIQERDQDGNLIQHSLNVNTQNAQMNEQQYQMMLMQQQIAQNQFDQQQMAARAAKSMAGKKKRGALAKKPPLASSSGTGAPVFPKKSRRPNLNNINTISHDEENYNPNMFGGIAGEYPVGRKNNSLRRPQTAKTKKAHLGMIGVAAKPKSRVNNFMVSSTPSHKVRGNQKGSLMTNTHGLVVPQSQMFTSFGVQNSRMHNQLASQRKSQKKKAIIPTNAASNFSRKKLIGQLTNKPALFPKKTKKGQLNFQMAPNQAEMQQIMIQNQLQSGNLIEMPILSEDFLNQLNEEQLQALLEQQQQLMMLQQQQALPTDEEGGLIDNPTEVPEDSKEQLTSGEENNGHQPTLNQQILDQQQALMQQYQQQLQPNPEMDPNMIRNNSLRTRGRGKAYTQSGRQIGGSGNRIIGKTGSASRSQGSRQRGTKTRSSLNVKSSFPFNNPLMSGGPQSLSVLPSSIGKGPKKAALIYGNLNLMPSISSNRKKPNYTQAAKKMMKGKRSQPNQGGRSKKFNELQAQIQNQQLQYNMINEQQLQTNLMLQQQLQMLPQQNFASSNQANSEGNIYPTRDGHQDEQDEDDEEEEEAVINEASPEQEEGESNNQYMRDEQSNIPMIQNQISNIADDLSTEQIVELLQTAQNQQFSMNEGEQLIDDEGNPVQALPEEVQMQLQQVLQQRLLEQQQQQFLIQQQQMVNQQMINPAVGDRVTSYANICNILTESVSKAKEQLAHLAPQSNQPPRSGSSSPARNQGTSYSQVEQRALRADERIAKQKRQFTALMKQYKTDKKIQEQKKMRNDRFEQKMKDRDEKIKAIKQRKFEEEMLNQQRSQMFKRNAQQVRLCKNVYRLASELEKNKLLEEKKQYRETEAKKVEQKQKMVDTIENYYKDKILMLKDKITSEKFERAIAQEAQKKALSQMKRELDHQKNSELQRYIALLQQEDEKFDIQNMYAGRMENEIVKMYKKK